MKKMKRFAFLFLFAFVRKRCCFGKKYMFFVKKIKKVAKKKNICYNV
jgi:hypothetical protein